MKLQRHLAYTYKGKRRYKNVIVLPDSVITKLGWKTGQDLEAEIKNGKLIVKMKQDETN